MSLQGANSAPNFNRLAGIYRWMEWFTFGPFLHRCRCTFLSRLAHSEDALILGDGDGRFTARLLRANPQIRILAIDGSSAMLRALTRRAGTHGTRVQTQLADIRAWQPESRPDAPPVDLVVTHFFLDCLTTSEVHSLAARLRPAVLPSAKWLVSEFAVPRGWFGSLVARPLVRTLYEVFALLTGLTVRTLPDHASALVSAGFTLVERRTHLAGLLVSELWSPSPMPGAPR